MIGKSDQRTQITDLSQIPWAKGINIEYVELLEIRYIVKSTGADVAYRV
jgi:hypothetical protein